MNRGTFPALDEVILLQKDVRINGGWDADFLAQTGVSVLDFTLQPNRSFIVDWSAKVTLGQVGLVATGFVNHGKTIFINGFIRDGYGMRTYGYLTVQNSTISGNEPNYGGYGSGLYNAGITEIQSRHHREQPFRHDGRRHLCL